jgi:hypothetical protein
MDNMFIKEMLFTYFKDLNLKSSYNDWVTEFKKINPNVELPKH